MLKSKQIQGLDSLRALGVLMVLIYHLFPTVLPGGFIGVDMFFAISGYLTTTLLIQEFRRKRTIALGDFYSRRLRRLLPAMGAMLGLSLSGSLLISSDFRVGIRRQAAAVLGFVTNYFEISGGKSYEDSQLPHLFVHTWTLSIEMHYYIIWAAAIAFVFFCLRKKEAGLALYSARRALTWTAMLLTGVSYLFMRVLTAGVAGGEDPSAGYFATHSHLFPVMLGSLTALHFGYRAKPAWEKAAAKPWLRAACFGVLATGTAGLAAMSLYLSFGAADTYSWGLPAASVTVCLMIIAVRLLQETRPLGEMKIMVWLGTRSFGIYLYHWPLLIIFSQLFREMAESITLWLVPLATLALTLPLAEISFRFIETRFRSGKKSADGFEEEHPKKPFGLRALAAALIVLALLGLSGNALWKEPTVTSLEIELTQERRKLDSEAMQLINDQLLQLTGNPVDSSKKPVAAPPPPVVADGTKKKYPGGVTMLGDSVMLGAATTLRDSIASVKVDAVVSRNMRKGIGVVDSYIENEKMRKNIVIGLSTNVIPASESDLREILDGLRGKEYRVVLVTGYGSKGALAKSIDSFAKALRTFPDDYDFCVVADWGAYAKAHPELLTADRVHLKDGTSRRAYVKIITDALDAVQGKPVS